MYFSNENLDDLMHSVLEELLKRPMAVKARRGEFSEIIGAMLHLSNPRSRLSKSRGRGKIFSAIGEYLWYMAGSNSLEFIAYYLPRYADESEDGLTIHGAYGPRLYRMHGKINQLDKVIALLRENPTSRRAVIQLFDAKDIAGEYKEIPCTCTLQFLIRDDRMNLVVNMRSNDANLGLPHDVFAFTMLQEIMARALGVEVGEYWHSVGSLHLYEKDKKAAQSYLDEGFMSTQGPMPSMPLGDPWQSIRELLKLEHSIRTGEVLRLESSQLPDYWLDLAKLLHIHALEKAKNFDAAEPWIAEFKDSVYEMYLQRKVEGVEKKKGKQL